MKIDRLTQGILVGLGAAVVEGIWSYLSPLTGLGKFNLLEIACILAIDNYELNMLTLILGLTLHIGMGANFGIIYTYLMVYASDKYYLLKGLWFGITLWLLHVLFGAMIGSSIVKGQVPEGGLSILMGAILFGLTTAVLWRKTNRFV